MPDDRPAPPQYHTTDKSSPDSTRTVAIAGGGTAGHIFPAIAVAMELAGYGIRCEWIGRRSAIERTWVTDAGIPFHATAAGKLRRYFSFRNLLDIGSVLAGLVGSWWILRRMRPAALLAKGGFVSLPPAVAAWLLGIPVIVHESDATPALTTRIVSRLAHYALLGFATAAAGLPSRSLRRSGRRGRLVVDVVGNPVRPSLVTGDVEAAWRQLRSSSGKRPPLLLVMGGSLGSRQINQLVAAALPDLVVDWTVVHQTGPQALPAPVENDAERVPHASPRYHRFTFVADGLGDLLAAATAVVCRAGANTLSEVALHGVPSILLPLPSTQSRGEQGHNAQVFAAAGAARLLGTDATPSALVATLRELKENPETLARMRAAALGLATPHAAARIASVVAAHVGRGER